MSDLPPPESLAPRKAPGLTIAAIVCASLGLCCMPLGLLGCVLGIVALVKHKQQPRLGQVLAIVAVGLFPVTMTVSIAIAIPAFTAYVRKAKSQEAVLHVPVIARLVQQAFAQSKELPPSIGATPATLPGEQSVPWPADSESARRFAELGLVAPEKVHYQYSYERAADGQSFVVRAEGDLDGDGTRAIYTMQGMVHDGAVVLGTPDAVNPVE